ACLEQALKLADGLAVVEFADALGPSSLETRPPAAPQDEGSSARLEGSSPRRKSPGPEEARSAVSKDEGHGRKVAKIHDRSGPERITFSKKFACPVSGFTIPEIEPRLFSFNNPFGACPKCGGLGIEQHIDPDLVVPDKE